ncbi:MAG TPA: DUF4350 domain-containing protein [Actinomycetota bacterium]|nr:DUF4350 domain-containing protein [Actinomycetota bacterium]
MKRLLARIPSGPWRWTAAGLTALLAINLALTAVDLVSGGPGGPTSSLFSTAPDGLAAFGELLATEDRDVQPVRADAHEAVLDRGSTLFVLDPHDLADEDLDALATYAREGGRLVVGGLQPHAWVARLSDNAPAWGFDQLDESHPVALAPETSGIEAVAARGFGSWGDTGDAAAVIGAHGRSLVAVENTGEGRTIYLADTSPLQNRLLASADNAALGLALAGSADRPVLFLESAHGYSEATGLAALPPRWKVALLLLTLAALMWMAAAARRIGPPERPVRALHPPRMTYVDSLAATLSAASGKSDALEGLRRSSQERLARLAGSHDTLAEKELAMAAETFGLSSAGIRALKGPVRSDDQVLALGRLHAQLVRKTVRP